MSTLRELATFFGLTHPDSMSNLTRRADKLFAEFARPRLPKTRVVVAEGAEPSHFEGVEVS